MSEVDFSRHVGEGMTLMERCCVGMVLKKGMLKDFVVDFEKRMEMASDHFENRKEQMSFKSGGKFTQVDYILYREGNLKEKKRW